MLGNDDIGTGNQTSSMSKWARTPVAELTDSTFSGPDAGLLDKPMAPAGFKVGDLVDDYLITSVLGVGGMGEVYRVRNLISGRMEAMKVLLPSLGTNSESVERFFREIQVQAALAHPNIATLHTARRVKNQILMIMECVEGVTLEKLLERGPMPLTSGVDYVCQVLEALSYAHSQGIIHRDVKPSNMIVTPNGTVKLMDFGVARTAAERRLTQTGMIIGSLRYMSPEQIHGVPNLDIRSDLYSVGIVLYEIVTGRRPFQGEGASSIIAGHLQQDPAPPVESNPKIPIDLSNVILMSIAKNPAERFQSADAFLTALTAWALPITSASPIATPKTGPTLDPQAAHRHRTSTTGRRARQRHSAVKSGTTSGFRPRRSSKAPGNARQHLPRSVYVAGSALVALVVLALTLVGQKLHQHDVGHSPAETAKSVNIQRLSMSVSPLGPQQNQLEQPIPKTQTQADSTSVVLQAKKRSLTTATKLRQREAPSRSSQPTAALPDTPSSETIYELKRFVPAAGADEGLPFRFIDPPPNISVTTSVTDVNLNLALLDRASAPPTTKAWHNHFLGRGAAGLLTIFGQRYRFQEDHSYHVFEGSADDLMPDCKPGNAICQIRVTSQGHKEVIRLKASDWIALQENFVNVGECCTSSRKTLPRN